MISIVLCLVTTSILAQSITELTLKDFYEINKFAPKLAAFAAKAITDPKAVAEEIRKSPLAAIAPIVKAPPTPAPTVSSHPIVFAHGMGDSCFNSGMKSITEAAGSHMGVYSVCVPTGDSKISDTMNGFFMTMDKNVDVFAAAIKKDVKLAKGFNAAGFSQGNSIIRGYVERYNDPPVINYISVHGTGMGVAGFPNCDPKGALGPVCDILAEVLGDLAYNSIVQNFLFQANYFRDPKRTNTSAYLENSQIASWNNENSPHANYASNFASLQSWTMIKAMKDTMIFPNDGEWWGQFTPGQFKTMQTMKETSLYQKDSFGLKTADGKGTITFNSTAGNHLQFTEEQLFWWMEHHFQ